MMVDRILEIGNIQITQNSRDLKAGSIGFTVTKSNARIKNIIYHYDQANFQDILERVKNVHDNYLKRQKMD